MLTKRMRLAERVVEFASGYALQSAWYGLRVSQGQSASPQEDIERALELAKKTVAVDPMSAQSHAVLGNAYLMKHENDKAIAAAQEAVRIQPSDAIGYAALGYFQHWAGLGEKAIDAVMTAMRLDPKPKERRRLIYPGYLGMAYFTAGRYQDLIATVNRDSAFYVRVGSNSLCFLAAAYIATGHDEKASAAMKAFLDKNPGTTLANYRHPRLYKRKEDLDRYLNLLRKAGLPE